MYRFRTSEIFLGCFLTVAIFAMGMIFVDWPYANQTAQHISSASTQNDSKDKQTEGYLPSDWLAWLLKDAAGFFTFGLAVIGTGQAVLFFVQLRYMRRGMDDAAIAANAARDGALATIEANEINRANFLADHRPWLAPKGEPRFVESFRPVNNGYITTIEVEVTNAGRSPAFKVRVIAELDLMNPKGGAVAIPEKFKRTIVSFSQWDYGGLIFPDSTITESIIVSLTDEDVLANTLTREATQTFYPRLLIGITYTSSAGTTHNTAAIYQMRGAYVGMEIPSDQLAVGLMRCEAT